MRTYDPRIVEADEENGYMVFWNIKGQLQDKIEGQPQRPKRKSWPDPKEKGLIFLTLEEVFAHLAKEIQGHKHEFKTPKIAIEWPE